MRWTLPASALALIAIVTTSALGGEAELPQQLQTVIDTYIHTRHQTEKISGAELHVDLNDHKPIDVYSGTNGRDGRPVNDKTVFQIGSNTKHFTAALVLKLEAEGRLDIDQTVGDWLPRYPKWAGVTIRSLLNMTSNIPNYSETVPVAAAIAANMSRQFTYDDLIDAVYDKGLPIPAGYFYSNTNSIVAAKIIEAASHMPYEDALEAMLAPLHLKSTFYEDGPYPPRVLLRLPAGIYDNRDCTLYQPIPCDATAWGPLVGQDVSRMNMSWAGPAGAMLSNTSDLAKWVRALFSGRVIPRQQLDEMTSLVSTKTGKPISDVSASDPAGFALDLGRGYQPALGGTYWFYQGTTFGFRTIFAYWPQYDLVITSATNSQPADNQDQFANTVVGGAFLAIQKAGLVHASTMVVIGPPPRNK